MRIRTDDPSRAPPRNFFRLASSVGDRDKPRDGNLASRDRPAAGLESGPIQLVLASYLTMRRVRIHQDGEALRSRASYRFFGRGSQPDRRMGLLPRLR